MEVALLGLRKMSVQDKNVYIVNVTFKNIIRRSLDLSSMGQCLQKPVHQRN